MSDDATYFIFLIESRIPENISCEQRLSMLCEERNKLFPILAHDVRSLRAVDAYIESCAKDIYD